MFIYFRLCDRLDSKSPFAPGNKCAITRSNLLEVEAYFLLAEEELRGLTDFKGNQLMYGINRTFVTGYISNIMKTCISLARDLFAESISNQFLLTSRLSQGPIEHFFGDIRSRGAWCVNPTAHYFMYSYRALVSNRLQLFGLSEGRNCSDLDRAPESEMGLAVCASIEDEAATDYIIHADVDEMYWKYMHDKLMSDTPTELRSNMLYYMSGWVARQVAKRLKCQECRESLFTITPFQNFMARLTRSVYRVVGAASHHIFELKHTI